MNAESFTPDKVREWLEYSPREPTFPSAPDLRGFVVGDYFYCSHCCGRLSSRGILLPREALPVWNKANYFCATCGQS